MAKLPGARIVDREVAVHPVTGSSRSATRIVAFLDFPGNAEVDVLPVLRRLDTATHKDGIEERNKVVARFRHWESGFARREWHHGWPDDPEFSMGYVFRWDHQRQHRRLYGFLVRARPDLEVCVLCCFRAKSTYATDKVVKRIVREMSQHPEVRAAIKKAFGQRRQGQWKTH